MHKFFKKSISHINSKCQKSDTSKLKTEDMQVLVTMVQNLLALAPMPYTAALFAYPLFPPLFCTLYYTFHKTVSLYKIDMHLR
jgi:hypothetical protein